MNCYLTILSLQQAGVTWPSCAKPNPKAGSLSTIKKMPHSLSLVLTNSLHFGVEWWAFLVSFCYCLFLQSISFTEHARASLKEGNRSVICLLSAVKSFITFIFVTSRTLAHYLYALCALDMYLSYLN